MNEPDTEMIERARLAGMAPPELIEASADLLRIFAMAYLEQTAVTASQQQVADDQRRLGEVIRLFWPTLTVTRSVSALADMLGVSRTVLYRVQDGKEWI